jgi:hypothetical protein
MKRPLAVAFLAAVLLGCTSPEASPSEPLVGSVPPGTEADAVTCDPIDLRMPSGELVDLTGTWLGNDGGLYEVRQFGECLWWSGVNVAFTHVLHGTIGADFTISAAWATVAGSDRRCNPALVLPEHRMISYGTMILELEFGSTNGTDQPAPAACRTPLPTWTQRSGHASTASLIIRHSWWGAPEVFPAKPSRYPPDDHLGQRGSREVESPEVRLTGWSAGRLTGGLPSAG